MPFHIHNHILTPADFYPSPHYDARPQNAKIRLITLHSISLPHGTYQTDYVRDLFLGVLDTQAHADFEDLKDLRVSSHLFIRRNALVMQFVPFNQRAWHAGVSSYKGINNCNNFSIGIELEGSKNDMYTDTQYHTLAKICACLVQHYPHLNRDNLVGHKDIAPERKDDPWNMDWENLKKLIAADT